MTASPREDGFGPTPSSETTWWSTGGYVSSHTLATRRPHFLVASPPKTGSTWLAANLRSHPEVFVPPAKELKYFSSLFKWLPPDWYLGRFAAGEGRVRGEASPSYAILPVERIRLLRRLMPDLKVVFLLRDPVARGWSHARHTHRFREATFSATAPGSVATAADWRASFAHDWLTTSGDYLGQLRRWLSVFPREQVYVAFYESIATRPVQLLRDVFEFLGVNPNVDLSGSPVWERILPGPPEALPPELRALLHQQWHARTAELADFLSTRLGLEPPPEWAATLGAPSDPFAAPRPSAFERDSDDAFLSRVLEYEEDFPTVPVPVLPGYLGYDIVWSRGRLFAVARHLGAAELPTGIQGADEASVRRLQATGACHLAPTLDELKDRVTRYAAERAEERARDLEGELWSARDRLAVSEAALGRTVAAVRRLEALEAEAVRVTPKELVAIERVRRTVQRLVRSWRWSVSMVTTAVRRCRAGVSAT